MRQDVNTRDAFDAFAERVINRAIGELKVNRQRVKIRAKWKKGKPKSFTRSKYWGKIDNSGRLKRSLRYTIRGESLDDYQVEFFTEDYGIFVDGGRMGRKKVFEGLPSNPEAKGAPPSKIAQWTEQKPVRPRDENGQFVEMTAKTMRTLSFLINRKIKWFGIEPTHFFRDAYEDAITEHLPKIEKAIAQDIAAKLNEINEKK